MNIDSRTDSAKGLRTHVIRGEITLPDIKTFLGGLYDSGEFDPQNHALWDLREAGFPEISPIEVRDLADFVRVHWAEKHPRKTAVVISGDFHFGLSRMFEQFIGPSAHGKIRTFREMQNAVEWIDGRVGTASSSVDGEATQTGRA